MGEDLIGGYEGEWPGPEYWGGYAPPPAPHIGHRFHLCEMCKRGDCTLDQVKALVRDPKFICRKCGRVAAKEENLCEPVPL